MDYAAQRSYMSWLIAKYKKEERRYALQECADCILQSVVFLQEEKPEQEVSDEALRFFSPKIKMLLAAMFKALHDENGAEAVQYLQAVPENLLAEGGWLPNFKLYYGLGYYEQQQWQKASLYFFAYLQEYPEDETAWFYYGNCLYQQGDFLSALKLYEQALQKKKGFFEAMANAGMALRELGQYEAVECVARNRRAARYLEKGKLVLYPWDSSLAIHEEDLQEVYNLPVFINARDRVGCLRRLVEWLQLAGYSQLYVLDNASTYPELLRYYELLDKQGISVILLGENLGHRALWESNILEKLQIYTPYVYTDPDVLPIEKCPHEFVQQCLRVLRSNSFLKKAGPGLIFEDITFYNKEFIQSIESQAYDIPFAKDVFYAGLDTTFAVYRNYRHYHLYDAVRLTGRYRFRHLPWYYDYRALPEDELYYLKHANASSTLGDRLKSKEARVKI